MGEVISANALGHFETSFSNSRRRLCLMGLAFGLSVVLGLGSIGLWGARERRFAACVADVVREGHWLIPTLWGRPRLEKPPLPYWICSSGALVTGHLNEWTLRLPGLLAALLIVSAVYSIGSDAGGRCVGLLAALLLLSSFYFASELRQPSNDLFLTGFCAAALACWWRGYQAISGRAGWWAMAGVCAGLAIASKGPVALAVMAPPIMGFLACQRELTLRLRGAVICGLLLALAVGLAWPIAVLAARPDAWMIWFWDAVPSATEGSYFTWLDRGVWYYLAEWPTYLFPWSVISVAAVRYGWSRREDEVPRAVRFAWLWFFGDLLIFTLFATRKNYYLMPAVPGLAIAGAYSIYRLAQSRKTRREELFRRLVLHAQLALLTLAGLALAAAAWAMLERFRWIGVLAGLGVATICAVIHRACARRGRVLGAYLAGSLLFCAVIGIAYTFLLPSIDAARSHRSFMAQVAARLPERATVYFWGEPDPSFWFYLDHPMRPVNALPHVSAERTTAYCLVAERDLSQEPDLGLAMEILATDLGPRRQPPAVLGQIGLPLEGAQIYTMPDPLHHVNVPGRSKRPARQASESPREPTRLSFERAN